MASNTCFAAFAATEEVPIQHNYGFEVLTVAKKIFISSLLLKADKVDMEEFLKTTFNTKKQIILAPYYGGNAFSLEDIPFEALEEICIYKPSSEPFPIVVAHNNLRTFVHSSVLENLATSIHKEFASYYHPVEKQQLMRLGNRKIYSTDKQKIQQFEQSKKMEEATKKKSEARAALPSTSTKQAAKISHPAAKSKQDSLQDNSALSQANLKSPSQPSTENDKKRSTRREVNYKESSENSTSSVEYPVEGKHIDDESEREASDPGNRKPIFSQ